MRHHLAKFAERLDQALAQPAAAHCMLSHHDVIGGVLFTQERKVVVVLHPIEIGAPLSFD